MHKIYNSYKIRPEQHHTVTGAITGFLSGVAQGVPITSQGGGGYWIG